MPINPSNILALLQKKLPIVPQTQTSLEEYEVAEHLFNIIEQCMESSDAEFEVINELVFDEYEEGVEDVVPEGEIDDDTDEESDIETGAPKLKIPPNLKEPTKEEWEKVSLYYHKPKSGRRTLKSMQSHFRWFKQSDFQRLRR
jgi:hypothetical protein